jgi:hypothetical protein
MSCLNEAETVARCVTEAKAGLGQGQITGDVLVADNGSTDGAQAPAAGGLPWLSRRNGYGQCTSRGPHGARAQAVVGSGGCRLTVRSPSKSFFNSSKPKFAAQEALFPARRAAAVVRLRTPERSVS